LAVISNNDVPAAHRIMAASLIISAFLAPLSAQSEEKVDAAAKSENAQKIEINQKLETTQTNQLPQTDQTNQTTQTNQKVAPAKSKAEVVGAEPTMSPTTTQSKEAAAANKEAKLLKATVTQSSSKSPLLYDSVQELTKGTTVDLVSLVNINSEVNKKGDEIWVRVGRDIQGQSHVAVPGGWYMHGVVSEAAPGRRGGLDGYVTVKFDKLVSPDRQLEVPFDAHVTSKAPAVKAIAKLAMIDAGHVSLGALGGSIMAVQFGGMTTAVATHGISVGIGAGIGATIGLIGAAKRKGDISSIFPGDQLKLVVAQPINLPGFDSALIPSAKPIAKLENFEVLINKVGFAKDPWGDNKSKLMLVDLTVNNKTAQEYRFSHLAVVSDQDEMYYPSPMNGFGDIVKKKVKPNRSETGMVAFSVDGKRHKYWLVLLDSANQQELNRVPIN
jgi:hypothetical protein